MFNLLRPATKDEFESIKASSDIGPNCTVVALDTPNGAILSVVRQCWEVDPMHFPEGCDSRHKAAFLRDICHYMVGLGAPSFYFNINASEEFAAFREAVVVRGAEQVSVVPEIRFKRDLSYVNNQNHN